MSQLRDVRPPVSVVIPVLDESRTIGSLVQLLLRSPLVREIVVVDDGSVDKTSDVASRAGARVVTSTLLGKGASMEDGIRETTGELVLFLDGDLLEVCDDLVERMATPLLSGEADFVKASFSRSAGRVTVLTARPLLTAFFPEVASFQQPLGGIVAARRSLLSGLPLDNDYGVDVGLLIDTAMQGARQTEVDIGWIDHESQSLEALGDMAKQISRTILDRAWCFGRLGVDQLREAEEAERRHAACALPTFCPTDRRRRFALFDMDGVLLDGRYVVELAKHVGNLHELNAWLDNTALSADARTAGIASLFAGVDQDLFERTARSIPLIEGAAETIVALRRAGYSVGIVTDSFQVAAQVVRRRVFADFAVAHLLTFTNRVATGDVVLSSMMQSADGCPDHNTCKSNVVRHLRDTAGLMPERTLAVGDSDNDACMLRMVSMGVAFRPKSDSAAQAAAHTVHGTLSELLALVGILDPRAGTESACDRGGYSGGGPLKPA